MAKQIKETAAAQPKPIADEHAGIGGSYLIDANGVKTLVERTAPLANETTTTDAD